MNLPIGKSIVQESSLGFGSSYDLILAADSLYIIFDTDKILVLNDRINDFRSVNILNSENYEQYRDNNKYYYNYIFSNIDFENAEDCNGNCE